MKLTNCGITVDVPENETSFYTRAGYKKVEEPGEIPAPEKPKLTPEEKAALKAAKKGDGNPAPSTEPATDSGKTGEE